MRTTAVYGSGKLGASDRANIAQRPELAAPFQVEMLIVWLIFAFTVDIVVHIAAAKGGGNSVKLNRGTCRTDLSPKFPPALRGVLGVKSLALGCHLVHRLSLQKFHWRQVAQC